ncbi:MAG: iron-sulfur cluster biosynthesis family protein [Clostridiaceae bacterium]
MNISFDEKAALKLKEYVDLSVNKAIRLKVLGKGCGKPALGIFPDEQRENDIIINLQGIKFLADKNEEIYLTNVEILYSEHYVNNGFYVRSIVP